MSIQTEITRIQTDRNTIRTKLVELGMATATDNLDALATAVSNITNRGSVSATVTEGATYTIPAGYHDGSGTVSGVAGGGNYDLQSKTVTPTKSQQAITADSGYYGLSDVTVKAIPANYQDVSSVTAGAADVLANKVIVNTAGQNVAGTMPNNGTVNKTLSTATTSFTIAKGYHSGSGKVTISTETKTVTPTDEAQTVSPASGKVLSSVTVNAIPAAYANTTDATATAGQILSGQTAYIKDTDETGTASIAKKVTGTMANQGAKTATLTASSTSYTIPAGYHNGSGKVSIVTETKSITPTKSSQTVSPTSGKVLSSVTVAAIPAQYITTTDATAVAANILYGKTAYVGGSKVTGSMADNGSSSKTMDGLTVTSISIPAGYTTGGTVSLTSDIETALAAI